MTRNGVRGGRDARGGQLGWTEQKEPDVGSFSKLDCFLACLLFYHITSMRSTHPSTQTPKATKASEPTTQAMSVHPPLNNSYK